MRPHLKHVLKYLEWNWKTALGWHIMQHELWFKFQSANPLLFFGACQQVCLPTVHSANVLQKKKTEKRKMIVFITILDSVNAECLTGFSCLRWVKVVWPACFLICSRWFLMGLLFLPVYDGNIADTVDTPSWPT